MTKSIIKILVIISVVMPLCGCVQLTQVIQNGSDAEIEVSVINVIDRYDSHFTLLPHSSFGLDGPYANKDLSNIIRIDVRYHGRKQSFTQVQLLQVKRSSESKSIVLQFDGKQFRAVSTKDWRLMEYPAQQ